MGVASGLVDAHDPAVSEHHGSCLEAALPSLRVRGDGGRETHARGAAPGCGDGEGGDAEHEAQELRLCGRRVANLPGWAKASLREGRAARWEG